MVLVKEKEGSKSKGNSIYLGEFKGNSYYLYSYMATVDVPLELALKLLNEKPQRVELVNPDELAGIPLNLNITKQPKEEDIEISAKEIESIPGIGAETTKDILAIFNLVKNVHTNKDLIRILKADEHIPLQKNVAKKLKNWLLKRYPNI